MTDEIKLIKGKHTCKRNMDMRLLQTDDKLYWIIYGVCNPCEQVVMCAIFDKKPTPNLDYIIDYSEALDVDEVKGDINGLV